ncbi:E3 ubiquitin-protein ligase MARCHF3 [Dendroctonus ponderosae]|uniref:RING-CH-type domain-containing protein n=1 Tax=Dendroctonus ponderosae TaxID=77166 RepID=A0AAR5PNE5_DENPD|nr:E3 ubiquitin-protein ligase MARCHF3 [Dendroctonus ponderosae]
MSDKPFASNSSKNFDVLSSGSAKFPSTPKPPVQVPSANFSCCRICQTVASGEPLISPCNCKGTLAYIHLSCLERWLNQSGRNFCELCNFRYDAIETQRYSLCQSIRLWICHPRNRRHIRSDFIIGVLLTLVTSGLLFICIYGMEYFAIQAEKVGVEKSWIKFSLISFLIIILLGYLVSIYLLLRDHYVPWYTWWTRTVNIRLQIPCRRTQIVQPQVM